MYVNKYNWWRRSLYKVYRVFPFARVLKRLSQPHRIAKLRAKNQARGVELEQAAAATGHHPLFSHVEIETINRCNGECGFCPVNRHMDPRPAARMSDKLYESIVDQLAALDYSGSFFPFSNNEPLLDVRIYDFIALARERLPKARIGMYSNGLLLNKELYLKLIAVVDDFVINNYCDDFRLMPNVQEIHELSQSDASMFAKTRVVVRYRQEIMTSRGGQSPNKLTLLPKTLPVGCPLPTKQLIIRPDGKLSLCCNDAIGKMTLGDLNRDSILDIWNSEAYSRLRMQVLGGRGATELCRQCDTLYY